AGQGGAEGRRIPARVTRRAGPGRWLSLAILRRNRIWSVILPASTSDTAVSDHQNGPPLATLLALHRTMCRIRAFEDAAEIASQGGVAAFGQKQDTSVAVRGPLHLSTGQEAVAAGV